MCVTLAVRYLEMQSQYNYKFSLTYNVIPSKLKKVLSEMYIDVGHNTKFPDALMVG